MTEQHLGNAQRVTNTTGSGIHGIFYEMLGGTDNCLYIGKSVEMNRHLEQHSCALRDPEASSFHYSTGKRALSHRMIILALLPAEQDMLALAEQLFVLLTGSYARWLSDIDPNQIASASDWVVQSMHAHALTALAQDVYDQTGWHTIYDVRAVIGLNIASPAAEYSKQERIY